MTVYRSQCGPIFEFWWKTQSNYFAVIGDFFKVPSLTGNIFIDLKNDSTTIFVSVPVIFRITIPAGIYLLKVYNRNTKLKVRNMFKVNNKNTKTRPIASFWCLIVNFEHISHICSSVFIGNFEYVIAGWS